MRASDATGRTATKRSERRCIVALGMLERRRERNEENVNGEGEEREGGDAITMQGPYISFIRARNVVTAVLEVGKAAWQPNKQSTLEVLSIINRPFSCSRSFV